MDYEKLMSEVERVQEELANIPMNDEKREALVRELEAYNRILSDGYKVDLERERDAAEVKARRRERWMGFSKIALMSATALVGIALTTGIEKEHIISQKAWQIAMKILPIAKV